MKFNKKFKKTNVNNDIFSSLSSVFDLQEKSFEDLIKEKDWYNAENLVLNELNKKPEDITLHEKYAYIAYLKDDLPEAVKRYEAICTKFGYKTPVRICQSLHAAHKRLGNKKKEVESFKKISSVESKKAEQSYRALLAGNPREAYEILYDTLKNVFDEERTFLYWLDSYKCICDIFVTGNNEKNNLYHEDFTYSHPAYKKIIVSGMGWSGSGALFDYFKEFSSVIPVNKEYSLIEGSPGLKSLRLCADDYISFRKELLFFFGSTLLGFSEHETYLRWKASKRAINIALSDKGNVYAQGVNLFCKEIVKAHDGSSFNFTKFKHAANILIDSIAKVYCSNENYIVLMDNIIHAKNLKEIEYIDNTVIFYVFRDPRSNYVSRLREDRKITGNVYDYIKKYKSDREKSQKMADNLEFNKEAVHFVQFEEFVLSESYRNNLAALVGLDLATQNKNKYFQPSISEKNVFLHEVYENQEEIKIIEKALSEYCVDVHKLKHETHK